MVEIGLLVVLLGVVSLLTDLPPANTPGLAAGAPARAPAGGPVSLRLGGAARLALWPGFAGRNMVDLRLPGHAPSATVVAGSGGRQTTLRRAPDGTYAGLLPSLPAGAHAARHRRGRPHVRGDRDARRPQRAHRRSWRRRRRRARSPRARPQTSRSARSGSVARRCG